MTAPVALPAKGSKDWYSWAQWVDYVAHNVPKALSDLTGKLAASAVTGLAAVAVSGSAADLGAGTLPSARLPLSTPLAPVQFASTVTLDPSAGTAFSVSATGNFTVAKPAAGADNQTVKLVVYNAASSSITLSAAAGVGVAATSNPFPLTIPSARMCTVSLTYYASSSRWLAHSINVENVVT